MQFRKVANRMQCLVAVYDARPADEGGKRTRQKMIYSFPYWQTDFSDLQPVDLNDGTDEQRAEWVEEIRAYGAKKHQEMQAYRDGKLAEELLESMDKASKKIGENVDFFDGSELKKIRASIARLTKALDERVEKKKRKTS
ncbi:hypothetical protein [Roseibium aggregatum]|uniref:Uncharacterized protein n=1 Tax=Roseibium aggregatum TaxID=187304 RepID=A0A0M6YEM3_9HYPH|nr:hypothetical protein [Roseibium aggregatum]CTQ47707.1 hypothetical protein LAL4801_06169 [Roseibium aggregatum]